MALEQINSYLETLSNISFRYLNATTYARKNKDEDLRMILENRSLSIREFIDEINSIRNSKQALAMSLIPSLERMTKIRKEEQEDLFKEKSIYI